jgi:transposase InsO family protein
LYYEWKKREGEDQLADLFPGARGSPYAVLDEEKQAVIRYALEHPREGYRRLTWMMVDEDVAFLSESSVYRILDDEDLLYRWKRSRRVGTPPPEPTGPNQRWHTDIMYLRVEDSWYFLVTVLDAYSRYVVHWTLLPSMTAQDVRGVFQAALERTGAHPAVVSDNGSQFTAAEFRQLVRLFALEHIRIRTYHPQSNGVVERFHRTTREAVGDPGVRNLSQARAIIARWVAHYNPERLHAALGYLPPGEYYQGNPAARHAERQVKLVAARPRRRAANPERLQAP